MASDPKVIDTVKQPAWAASRPFPSWCLSGCNDKVMHLFACQGWQRVSNLCKSLGGWHACPPCNEPLRVATAQQHPSADNVNQIEKQRLLHRPCKHWFCI
eukprot:1151493-Pelagomonas_calceolata.AAC.4